MAKHVLHEWYKQYQKLKIQHPDTILLYRMGEFYEAFDDDAKLVSEQLDVVLSRKEYATDRSKGKAEKIYCPMAGIPFHAAEGYVARLVSQGYRVAIAEQLSHTPSTKSDTRPRSIFASGFEPTGPQRGLVHREVVRVLTPGTVIDPSMLQATRNNYLVAVLVEGDAVGLSYADLSTGEFAATEFQGEDAEAQLMGELSRLMASEILVSTDEAHRPHGLHPSRSGLSRDIAPVAKGEREALLPHERIARKLDQENDTRWAHGHVTAVPDWRWELATAREALLQHFRTQSLAGFGLEPLRLATRAAGVVIQYIGETQRTSAIQITTLRAYSPGEFMVLDPQTRRNLELLEGHTNRVTGSLVGVLDVTRTPMGARLIRQWISQPLLDLEALHRRQEAIEELCHDGVLRATIRQGLSRIGDMERVVNRVMQAAVVTTPRDLAHLRQALRALPDLVTAIGSRDLLLFQEDEPLQPIAKLHRGRDRSIESGPNERERKLSRRGVTPSLSPLPTTSSCSLPSHATSPPPRVVGDDLFGPGAWPHHEAGAAEGGAEMDAPSERIEPSNTTADEPSPCPTSAASELEPSPPDEPLDTPQALDPCHEVLELLERAIDDDPPALLGGSQYLGEEDEERKPRRVIRPGYDPRIDQIVQASREAQSYINNLEGRERERTGIKSLKVGYNKVFGYYIEVSRSYSKQVPPHYERKQTTVNTERYVTAELKEYETLILNAQQRLIEYERETFSRICTEVSRFGLRLRATARALARLDVVAALAEVAVRNHYIRPSLTTTTRLDIRGGRHPVVEQAISETFVPNDVQLDTEQQQILLITGPNMAGKSTILRQIAVIVLMAQIGSFVPASYAEIGLVDRIFTRIGAQDDIATGRSTFMVEMTETAALLMQSTRRSLIILDEVGRGTSTYDGMAIAQAVVEYLHHEPRLRCRTLFATHYHELTELEAVLPRVKNYHMAAVEHDGRVVFLYELRKGRADRSYGIHVAELAGIPRPVIRRATELLAAFERGTRRVPTTSQDPDPALTSARGERQPSLFDAAPNPVITYLRRLRVNELSPIEALNTLYELQQLALRPLPGPPGSD